MRILVRPVVLSCCTVLALGFGSASFARDLGNFDINVAATQGKALAASQSKAPRNARQSTDVLDRAAFTWVQQDLPAVAKAKAGDPEAAARAHLSVLLGAAKRSGDVAQSLQLRKVDMQRGGAQLVQFQAKLDGVAIFREDLALLMDSNHRLVAMRGPLPTTSATAAKSLPRYKLDASQAVAAALSAYDFPADVAKRLQPAAGQGEYLNFTLDDSVRGSTGAVVGEVLRVKRVYFRTHSGLQPAWYVETQVADSQDAAKDYYAQVISARDGSVLFRLNQLVHAQSVNYRVWAENSSDRLPFPSPEGRGNTPDPDGLPSNNVVPFIAQDLRSLANAPFSRSATDGWITPPVVVTGGNNAYAFADLSPPDGFTAGDIQPRATSPFTFDYIYDTQLTANANVNQTHAVTVQAFYLVNWMHDWLYDHGFAEADGNAQIDNFGRGGVAGDPLAIETQDSIWRGNASMSTPADGFIPTMQLGIYDEGQFRDSGLDATVVLHEFAHYVSHRLVLDAAGLDTVGASGLGEGWSDFFALLALSKENDRLVPSNASFNGAYSHAGYASQSSYHGNRRYPYSANLAKNPLSLRHVVDGALLPTQPPPAFTVINNAEVHAQGEVWASALWDAYVNLLNDSGRLSFSQAQNRMKDYVIGGLKMTPASPTMTEARDAILATILASGQNADFALFTAAFAKRGLGAGALIPDRYSRSMAGVVESTALGADIAVTSARLGVPQGCDADAILDVGESASVSIALDNSGFTALTAATATLSSDNPALSFPSGATVNVGNIAYAGAATVSIPIKLSSMVAPNTPITVTVTPDAVGINSPPGYPATFTTNVNIDQAARSSVTETFDTYQNGWANAPAPATTKDAVWKRRFENAEAHWHGSDEHFRAVNWTLSPVMSVGSGALTMTLNHRHSFERDIVGNWYDGGVIQTSIDGGVSWSNVDADVAGYATSLISDCCGNPLAGQRAFLGSSSGYPLFTDRVINFGTAFANQTNFRLRFGVATDVSVAAQGWDINTITMSGLTDTPFSVVTPQSAGCSVSNHKTLQGAMSGTYSSSARSGEGVLVDFGQVGGTPVVFFTWYTYGQTDQQWLVGSNVFSATDTSVAIDLINTSGASFGSGFDPQDVSRNAWGSVALTFPDCDTMTMTYQKAGGEAGTLTFSRVLGRLAPGQCNLLNGGQSGTYYSTSRSGEGVLIDFGQVGGTPIEFFTWYTYGAGTQQWLVGSQSFTATDASVSVDLINTSGASFGNAFRPQDVVRTPWGRVTHRFTDCNTLELKYQKTGGESGTQVLTRALGRLGDGVCH